MQPWPIGLMSSEERRGKESLLFLQMELHDSIHGNGGEVEDDGLEGKGMVEFYKFKI